MADTRDFIIATAGHVDHGKSALVLALTGTDPDRLPEEKARGITIDLGFAALELAGPSGVHFQVGIVDVPGHEDFVRNMVAGVGAANLALLVVAADDGWMPQTEEHLQVLLYLGVTRAVVALTKADLVSDIEVAVEAVRVKLEGTAFADAPIVPTSTVTGQGVQELREVLARALAGTPASPDIGKPRLAVDRVFTLTGIGTVVTGTLLGGSLQKGQAVVLQPAGISTRIRRIQSYNRDVEVSGPGRRTALNVPDLAAEDVRRGDVVTLPACGSASACVDAAIEVSPRAQRAVKNGARVHVHFGSGHVGATLLLLGVAELAPGGSTPAQLRLDRPVFVFECDRITIRDWAEQTTLGGGVVLDAKGDARTFRSVPIREFLKRRAGALGDVEAWVDALVRRDILVPREGLLAGSNFSQADVDQAVSRLVASGVATAAGDALCLTSVWSDLREQTVAAVYGYHSGHPDQPGMPLTELRAHLGTIATAGAAFDALLVDVSSSGLVREGSVVRRASHRLSLPPVLQETGEELRAQLTDTPLDPPSRKVLAPDATSQRALRFLLENGEAVEISSDLVLGADTVARAREIVAAVIRSKGAATLADIRDQLPCSRRVLVPLLDFFDRTGLTVRRGDARTLR